MPKKKTKGTGNGEFIPCTVKQLPQELRLWAALQAIRENPVNRPANVTDPQRISVLTSKYFRAGKVDLTVGFLENVPAALQDKIVSFMNRWGPLGGGKANVRFQIVQGSPSKANVRISLRQGGYWSYLGVDVMSIPGNQQTMNLQGFSLNTPESEYFRVVCHETGHTLGAPHEHERQEIVNRLNAEAVIADMMRSQGWSRQEIIEQVLTPIPEASIKGTLHAEEDSIMAYWFPGRDTKNGQPIVGGTKITESDMNFMASIYPLPDAPVPPPNPPPEGGTWKITLATGATITGTGPKPTIA